MSTRFYIEVRSKDGKRFTLTTDIEETLCPKVDDYLLVYDALSTRITDVSYAPTQDPMVIVRGKSITCETTKEANQLAADAKAQEGWFRIHG